MREIWRVTYCCIAVVIMGVISTRGAFLAHAFLDQKEAGEIAKKETPLALNLPPFLPVLPGHTLLTFRLLTSSSSFFLPTPAIAAPFAPGDTLDPGCSPGDADCYVEIPPAGSDGEIQFNNGGSFGGATDLFWDDGTNYLGVGDATPSYKLDVTGVIQATSGFRTNSETITDFTGTGIQNSSGALSLDINSLTEESGFASGDFLAFYDTTAGAIRKVDYDDLPSGGGGSPGGSDTQIQYNNGGSFGGDSGLTWDDTNDWLGLVAASGGGLVINSDTGIVGNTRGTDAVDIQADRTLATQVASGNGSVTVGLLNTSSGLRSLSFGHTNTVSTQDGSAFGVQNSVTGTGATSSAVGYLNSVTSSGSAGNAFGSSNTVSGGAATALGYQNTAEGSFSTAAGYGNTTDDSGGSANRSSAFGTSNTASANYANAFGYGNTASASGASAFGNSVTNSTANSTAIGPSNTAKLTISSAGAVGFANGAFTFPTADGTNGQVLQTDGSGGVTWETVSGSSVSFGSDNQIPFTNAAGNDFDYASGFTFNGTNSFLLSHATASGYVQSTVINSDSTGRADINVENNFGEGVHLYAYGTSWGNNDVKRNGVVGSDNDLLLVADVLDGIAGSSEIHFLTGGNYGATLVADNSRMTIDSSGDIGIGDITPAYRFTVGSGDVFGINSSGAIVAVTGLSGATGTFDFGGSDSFEITNSATPTVNAAGEIAVDTTITDHTGLIKYYDGTEELTVIAVPTGNLTTTDDQILAYDADSNEFYFKTDASGGGGLTVGSDNQVPYSNSGGTDFDYSSNFTFDGADLVLNTDDFFIDGSENEIGIGTASPTDELHVRADQNGGTTVRIENQTAGTGAEAKISVENDTGEVGNFGIYSSSTTAYGAISPGDVYLYTNNAQALTLVSDTASGIIEFATGGNTEVARFDSSGNLSVGTTAANGILTLEGVLALDEISAPSNTAGYGKVYVKSSDSLLYFKDDGGTEYDLTAGAAGGDPDQNLWETVAGDSGSTAANIATDTLTIAGGTGITTAMSGDTLTITASGGGSVSFGSDNQVPYTNGTTDDFDYSSNFTFDGADLNVDASTLFVDGSENRVGIGETSPDYALHITGAQAIVHVEGTTNAQFRAHGSDRADLILKDSGAGADDKSIYLRNDGGITKFMSVDDADTGIIADNIFVMDHSSGDVGFGISTPATRLDIDAGSNTDGLRLRGLAESAEIADFYVDSLGQLVISTTAGTDSAAFVDIRPEDDEYGIVLRESDGTGTTPFANFYVADASDDYLSVGLNAGQTGTDALYVTASDNVGIGTSAPHAKLTIYDSGANLPVISLRDGDVSLGDWSGLGQNPSLTSNETGRWTGNSSSSGGLAFSGFTTTTASATALVFSGYQGSTSPTGPNTIFRAAKHDGSDAPTTLGNDEIAFQFRNWTSELISIMGDGDVGLGTTSPGAKLDVDGSAIFNESGADVDFRIEGDTDSNLFFVDASTDRIGIGESSPDKILHINAGTINSGIRFESTDADAVMEFVDNSSSANPPYVGARGDNHIFGRSSNIWMFIEDGGDVGIGNTAPAVALHVGSSSVTDSTDLLRLEDANSTCNFNADTGSPSCGSDETLKKNIENLDGDLQRILDLRTVTYNWKTDGKDDPTQFGFIAQEVQDIFPHLVTENEWIDGSSKLFLNSGGLIPHIVGALQELEDDMNIKLAALGVAPESTIESVINFFHIITKKITTDELCIGDTCITEAELIELLENSDVDAVENDSDSNNTPSGGNTAVNAGDTYDEDGNIIDPSIGEPEEGDGSGGATYDDSSGDDTENPEDEGVEPEPEEEPEESEATEGESSAEEETVEEPPVEEEVTEESAPEPEPDEPEEEPEPVDNEEESVDTEE